MSLRGHPIKLDIVKNIGPANLVVLNKQSVPSDSTWQKNGSLESCGFCNDGMENRDTRVLPSSEL